MKRSNDFLLTEMAGSSVLLPVGRACVNMNGMIKLNDMGKFLWNKLEKEITEDALVAAVLEEYNATEAQVRADLGVFLRTLREAGCLTPEGQK